jgi:antitoxin ParD1/3/4
MDAGECVAYSGVGRFRLRKVQPGRYQTASELVREALRLLERREQEREEVVAQLKVKWEQGAALVDRGEWISSEEAYQALSELTEERRRRRSRQE